MIETPENIKEAAVHTLVEIWSCIDWDKVTGSRAIGIWDEFANKVKAAAMTTNSYPRFVEKLARKMDVRSLKYKEIADIQNESEFFQNAILKLMRDETLSIVLQVRLNNQIRKEQAALEKERKEEENRQVKFTEKGVETL